MTEIPEVAKFIVDTGLSASLLAVLIWVVKNMLTQFDKSSKEAFTALKDITQSKDAQLSKAFDQHVELSKEILAATKQFHKEEADQRAMLTAILTRMEEKLDQPVRCPAVVADRSKH